MMPPNKSDAKVSNAAVVAWPPPAACQTTAPVVSILGRLRSWFHSTLKSVAQLALLAGLCCLSYRFISQNLVQAVKVDGPSMYPTLQDAERLLLNRLSLKLHDPKPRDIIVLRDPKDHDYVVKRIVAKEGDEVYLKNGRVYLNGHLLKEPYLVPGTPTYGCYTRSGNQLTICGRNTYFVLGDNRQNSMDSRVYGPVPRQNILGIAVQ